MLCIIASLASVPDPRCRLLVRTVEARADLVPILVSTGPFEALYLVVWAAPVFEKGEIQRDYVLTNSTTIVFANIVGHQLENQNRSMAQSPVGDYLNMVDSPLFWR